MSLERILNKLSKKYASEGRFDEASTLDKYAGKPHMKPKFDDEEYSEHNKGNKGKHSREREQKEKEREDWYKHPGTIDEPEKKTKRVKSDFESIMEKYAGKDQLKKKLRTHDKDDNFPKHYKKTRNDERRNKEQQKEWLYDHPGDVDKEEKD